MVGPEKLWRLARFAVVGVVVLIAFTGMNWLWGLRFGKDLSFILSYPPAIGLHYGLNKHWTFGDKRGHSKRQVSEYLVVVLVTFLIQAAIFGLLTRFTTLPGWAAACAASGAQMIISFAAMQYRIFRPDPAKDNSDLGT
jgi:putative flippase GtrA